MAEQLHINAVGLVTDPNPLALPPGALTSATNVIIKRPGVIEPRPGFLAMNGLALPAGYDVVGMHAYDGDVILVLTGGGGGDRRVYVLSDSHEIDRYFSGGWGGASDHPPLRAAPARGNLYLTSNWLGVGRIASASDTAGPNAGLRRPSHATVASATTGGLNYPLAADQAVAYRLVRHQTVGDVELRSAPSARVVQRSYTGSSDKRVTLTLAADPGDTIEVYRSVAFAEAYSDEPTNEMAMIGTTMGTSYVDDVPTTGVRGAALYTNGTQQGALLENQPPPDCRDLAYFQNMMFFAGAQRPPALTFEVLGFGSDWRGGSNETVSRAHGRGQNGTVTAGSKNITGVAAADVLAIYPGMRVISMFSTDPDLADSVWPAGTEVVSASGTTVTVSNAALAADTNFIVLDWIELEAVTDVGGVDVTSRIYLSETGGVFDHTVYEAEFEASTSANVEGPQALAATFAADLEPYGVSVSVFGDGVTLPWTFLAEMSFASDSLGADRPVSITVRCSRPDFTSERIDDTTGKTATFDDSVAVLAWSKAGEPEHVPPGYFVEIGASDKAIQRIVPTRDSLFVFKEDGIWRVSGYGPESISVSEFDRTVTLIHPDACCAWAGGVAAWTNKGVLLITEGGYTEIGAPIAASLASAEGTLAGSNCRGCFLVGWVARDLLILGVPGSTTSGYAQQMFVWCSRTGAWSTWEHDEHIASALAVDDTLYFGCAAADGSTAPSVLSVNDDGPDRVYDVTVSAVDGATVTIDAGSSWTPGIGDTLVSSDDVYSVTAATSATVFTVDRAGVSAGAATAEEGPVCAVSWAVAGGGDPGAEHLWRETSLLFGSASGMDVMRWSFATDREQTPTIITQPVGAYDANGKALRVRSKVPRQARRGNRLYPTLTISHARQAWTIEALSIVHEPIDTRYAGA